MIPYWLVGQKEFVNAFCEFYDLGWLPVGRLNIQKRNQVLCISDGSTGNW